jgi:hypothetical protein
LSTVWFVKAGWDVRPAVDVLPEGTEDDVLFEFAASNRLAFVTNDEAIQGIAERWLTEGRTFTALIFWPRRHHKRMSDGDIIGKIETLVEEDDPFAYPIIHIKPDD